MADFKKIIEAANEGYTRREDYPSFALAPWDDRNRWNSYLTIINDELNSEERSPSGFGLSSLDNPDNDD